MTRLKNIADFVALSQKCVTKTCDDRSLCEISIDMVLLANWWKISGMLDNEQGSYGISAWPLLGQHVYVCSQWVRGAKRNKEAPTSKAITASQEIEGFKGTTFGQFCPIP